MITAPPSGISKWDNGAPISAMALLASSFILLIGCLCFSAIFTIGWLGSLRVFVRLFERGYFLLVGSRGSILIWVLVVFTGVGGLAPIIFSYVVSHSWSTILLLAIATINCIKVLFDLSNETLHMTGLTVEKLLRLVKEKDQNCSEDDPIEQKHFQTAGLELAKLQPLNIKTGACDLTAIKALKGKRAKVVFFLAFLICMGVVGYAIQKGQSQNDKIWNQFIIPCSMTCLDYAPIKERAMSHSEYCSQCMSTCLKEMKMTNQAQYCPQFFSLSWASGELACDSTDCPASSHSTITPSPTHLS